MSSIAGQLINHERFVSVRTALQHALERARQGDPQILPIIGPTRVGKSKLISRFADGLQLSGTDTKSRKVVFVMTPKHLTGRAVVDACLAGIGMRAELYNNHVMAMQAFIRAANKHQTELIIFDETQHMLERGTSTRQRDAADLLKGIFDQTTASMVLAGLPTLMGLFQHNEQLADRSRGAVEFYPYFWQGEDYRHFRSALAGALGFFADIGWHIPSASDGDFARRMYVATAGRYGLINKILIEVQTLGAHKCVAHYPEFAAAYRSAIQRRLITFNPFDQTQMIQTEHMALVYTQVMQEAGVTL
ncbi:MULTISPECIES: TniB family NTP-binding protein [Pseudomonas syringae group]|uniref:Transposition helper protein n=3 Tax=Pseudomonas syringae group TaxID=136849 RepID=A0A0P9N4R3_PSESX|nr:MULTISPECIES: TniB family NTP-binding protein [Pseudomonas syringae group]KPW92387.1 Transposition helper protein [Pseudomonas syringae pv. castaneae]KWS87340.1 transposition helper protein [Pseudomonas syringae pv. castaneae]RMS52788.1 Transposition helper protein [Pseudomonas amygdali pv. photiniae]RMS91168.1 Transposition helper protein [Pseudomonas savastanoi]